MEPNAARPLGQGLKEAVAGVLAEGQEVRRRVGELVERAAVRAAGAGDALGQVVRDTAEGGLKGLERVRESERGRAFADAMDGLADGLGRAAHGAKLTLEEAAGRGSAFAAEDLRRLSDAFLRLREGLTSELTAALERGSAEVRAGLGDVASHAVRTAEAARPALEGALAAVARDPLGAAGGAAKAAAAGARQGAGALFLRLSKLLQGEGEQGRS